MTVVSDFTVIQGDESKRIGDGETIWEKKFSTGGRQVRGGAVLMFMVKGLTYATEAVDVMINDELVGKISPYRWPTEEMCKADAHHWYTQIVNVMGHHLKDGQNKIRLRAAGYPEHTHQNKYDDFFIRDMVCFFQQNA